MPAQRETAKRCTRLFAIIGQVNSLAHLLQLVAIPLAAFLANVAHLVQPTTLMQYAPIRSLLRQRHFLNNQSGGTSAHLLSTRGAYTSHFLVQGLHSLPCTSLLRQVNAKDHRCSSWKFIDTKEVKQLQPRYLGNWCRRGVFRQVSFYCAFHCSFKTPSKGHPF